MNKFDPNDINLDGVLENNRLWAAQVKKEDPTFFHNIANQQSPKILWIGKCSL
jgi:carbonic anhydrase